MMSVANAGLRHHVHASIKSLHGLLLLECPSARRRLGSRLATTSVWQNSEQPRPNAIIPESSQGYKFLQNRIGECTFKLSSSASWEKASPFCTHAHNSSGSSTNPSSDGVQSNDKKKKSGNFLAKLLKNLVKALGSLLLAAILLAAALPSLLSSSRGSRAAISFANKSIPGTVSVSSMSLGWTKPVFLEGFSVKGTDGETVLSIPKVETKAPLWSLVLGKSGFGDCTITSPVIDLQQHPQNNLPRLALAVVSAETLLENSAGAKKQVEGGKHTVVPAAESSLSVQVKCPKGNLEVTNGKVIFPSDVASVLGDRLIIDVGVGPWATDESEELKESEDKNEGLPLLASLWSETCQAEAVGFFQQKASKFKLIKPLKAEMDLTPGVAKFYLARVNPLLGEIVGPAIRDEDMPDVIVQVTPTNLELPADHCTVNIAPMRVTIARGQVVDGILSVLRKQDLVKGRRNLTMQTSAIEAKVDMPSTVESSRLDILIADKVHVATWGRLDWIDETVQMTLAIPGNTLRDLLGLTKLPAKYYLKIPVGGSLDKPLVDWRTAGVGIAELTARQRGGQFMQGLFDFFESNDKSKTPTPEPIGPLPWETDAGN